MSSQRDGQMYQTLKVKEASGLCGLTEAQIRIWIESGECPFGEKIGGAFYIFTDKFHAYFKSEPVVHKSSDGTMRVEFAAQTMDRLCEAVRQGVFDAFMTMTAQGYPSAYRRDAI